MSAERLHDPGLVFLTANLTNGQSLDTAMKALIETLGGVITEPPSKEEVERVKTVLLRGLERALSDPQSTATGPLNTAIAQGDWRLMFLEHDRLAAVMPDDVVRVARTYLKASNRTVGYYIPDAAPDRTVVTPRPDLDTVLKGYKTTVVIAQGEAFDPTPANIEGRVSRSKLANGMKVVIQKAHLDARMVGRSSDASLFSLLASHELQGRTMKLDEQIEQKIRVLTAEQVNAAFHRHVDGAWLSIVKAGDFKAAGVFQ